MHSPLPWLANSLWMQSCRRAWLSFCTACDTPEESQLQILLSILSKNKGSQFGRENHFERITSVNEFQQTVAIQDYQDI
ncbi:MAG: GH3 auxin-responsive promoter family protein, partial [Calditrichota bacterium]